MTLRDYTYLVRYALAKPGALKAYKAVIRNQKLPQEALEQLSWQKTQALLAFAYKNVPWYRRTYTAIGLHPQDITEPKYFSQVPILRRDDLITHFADFMADGTSSKTFNFITTGGSTGTPLKIAVTKKRHREVQKWQMFNWWDTPLNANMASIYRGLPVQGLKKLALDVINWPQKVIRVDATHLTEKKINDFIEAHKRIKPRIIHGYVGAVDAIANHILDHNIVFDHTPNAIWLTAAPITSVQEHKITKAFGSPVCDQYGCSELFFIAAECPHKQGLHVYADSVRLEVVDEANHSVKHGQNGKLILTNLDEYLFPLIRYENGDQGRYLNHNCTCGMGLPLIDKVKGRLSDNINLPNGTILSGEYITTIFDDYTDKVKQFQVLQKKDLSIVVRIVLFNDDDSHSLRQIVLKEFGERIHKQVPLSIAFVDHIENKKGKLQFVIKE